MKIPAPRYPSPLSRFQPEPMDVEATKRDGWQEQHILVISANDERLDLAEQALIRRIGNRLYGSWANGGRHD